MNLPAQKSIPLKVFISPLLCVLLVACGQKGPLYIPEPEQQPTTTPQTLPEPGAAPSQSLPEQQDLPADEENGVQEPAGSDEAIEAAPE